MDIVEKIGLGTVQFGLDYGINNKFGRVKENEVQKILNYALSKGIDLIDTAYSYGESETVLGRFSGLGHFKVVSKFPKDLDPGIAIDISLKRLKIERFYGYLCHHFESLKNNLAVWGKVLDLKDRGLTEKVGFSLYFLDELDFLLEKFIEFDLIQVPYNIFDRRFEGYFCALRDRGVEIHVRSVFLQGLFFVEVDGLPEFFYPVREKIKEIQQISRDLGIPLERLLLSWALSNECVDRVIVGVDSFDQFKKNTDLDDSIVEKVRSIDWDYFKEDDEKIILPVNWRFN
ncbi:aldo/keto reductase [Hippea sp. KM1]|uniref:aldo/keto reductase n=1 Tax=Hippea sp. KM1 TaxID=944481 RepID=UPI00046D7C35|nr:aldo/keto reductase [Hippea sp. KM1]